MEVAGLTASIITLIGAATLAGATVSRIWGLRDAPPLYVLTALNEINDFKATLKLAQYALESLPETPIDLIDEEIARFLNRAKTSLAAFNAYLHEKVIRESANGSDAIILRRRAKLKEILGEAQSEMSVLQQELASIKLSLNTALTAMHIRNHGRLAMSIRQVQIIRSGSSTTLSAGDSTSAAALMEEAVTSTTIGTRSDQPIAAARDGVIVIQAYSTSRSCKKQCPCQCHMSYEGSSPHWLKGLVGAAFFSFTGVPFLNRRSCNFKLCANGATKGGNMHIQYMFPIWVLPFAIEMTASWRCLGGIGGTWSLRIPRIVQVDARKMKYVFQHGTVTDLEMTIHTYGMRGFDALEGFFGEPTLFELAIHHGRADFAMMLLGAGTDLGHRDCHGRTLAQLVCKEALRLNTWQDLARTPELIAARDDMFFVAGHDLVMSRLSSDLRFRLERSPADVLAQDSFGFTLLHWAVLCADQMTVDVLLKAGADVNAVCKQGCSALMHAMFSRNSLGFCQALIEHGADLNITDKFGNTVLDCALRAQPSRDKTIEVLLHAGFDIRHKSYTEYDVLSMAVGYNTSVRACSILLDFGAELDLPGFNGIPPAGCAIYLNRHELLELFVQRGAVLNDLTKHGYSIFIYYAASMGNVRTMQVLTKAKIEGLPMTIEYREVYWDAFRSRDENFVGIRQSPEVERAAFQALLDSIVPMDPKDIPSKVSRFSYEETVVPGSFPVDENEDEEEDEGSEFSLDDRVAFSGDDDDSSWYGYEDTQRANDAGNRPGHRKVTGITDDCDADVNGKEKSTSSDTNQDHTSSQMTVVS